MARSVPYFAGTFSICLVTVSLLIGLPSSWSQEAPPPTQEEKAQRKRDLERKLQRILDELEALKEPEAGEQGRVPKSSAGAAVIEGKTEPMEPGVAPELTLSEISVVGKTAQQRPEGLTKSDAERNELTEQPTRHLRESLESLPGMVVRQGNGPRDFNISIRGSGAKNAFGIRNIKLYEDGIPQTQSDGLSRTDLYDPWFYDAIEVTRGPSSSLYDNYALGGMVQLRTRRARDIGGFEVLGEGGSFGFYKTGLAFGRQYQSVEATFFGSYQAENGFIQHSDYWTATENLNLRFSIDDKQTLYIKAQNNDLRANVPIRLTQSQFNANPRQAGGLGTTTAFSLDQQRRDRRTIIGALYERQIDANTVLSTMIDFDVKNVHQPFGTITDNINSNFQHYTDLRHDASLLGGPLRSYVGYFVNYLEQSLQTFTNLNDFNASRGPLLQNAPGQVFNIGGRFREEWAFVPKWIAAVGFNYEHSRLHISPTNYSSTGAVASRVEVNRDFDNFAPEASLTFRPTDGLRYWTRASTGYGIPQTSNLTTGLNGLPGANFNLKPQKNLNIELGTESRLHERFSMQLVGFWTFFRDEIITQTTTLPTGGTGTFSVNAKESQYRGVELGWTWLLPYVDGWRLTGAFTHMESKYVRFIDQFVVGGVLTQVNQSGHSVPAVERNVLNTKALYQHPSGWGGWFELSWIDSFFVNNANTLGSPAYILCNLNIHDRYELKNNKYVRYVKSFFQISNLFDKTYVASAVPIADSTPDASKQAFFAGYGRAFYGGVTLGF